MRAIKFNSPLGKFCDEQSLGCNMVQHTGNAWRPRHKNSTSIQQRLRSRYSITTVPTLCGIEARVRVKLLPLDGSKTARRTGIETSLNVCTHERPLRSDNDVARAATEALRHALQAWLTGHKAVVTEVDVERRPSARSFEIAVAVAQILAH